MKDLIRFCLLLFVAITARTALACDQYYTGDCPPGSTPTPAPTLGVTINAPSNLNWNENSALQLRSSVSWSDGSRVAGPVYYTWVVSGAAHPNPNDGTFTIDPVTMDYNGGYVRLSIIDGYGNQATSQAIVLHVIPQQSSGGGGSSGPQVADCSIYGPLGGLLINNQSSQADCTQTCNNVYDNGHPYINCMWNGDTQVAPQDSCALYGPRGGVLTSFGGTFLKCTNRCRAAKAGHPRITCSWGDNDVE